VQGSDVCLASVVVISQLSASFLPQV